MTELEKYAITSVIAFALSWLTFLFREKKKNEAERKKLGVDTNKTVADTEMAVAKFYQEQLNDLLGKYKGLNERFELQEQESRDCETRFQDLDAKYHALQVEINLLKKNIKI